MLFTAQEKEKTYTHTIRKQEVTHDHSQPVEARSTEVTGLDSKPARLRKRRATVGEHGHLVVSVQGLDPPAHDERIVHRHACHSVNTLLLLTMHFMIQERAVSQGNDPHDQVDDGNSQSGRSSNSTV